MSNSNKIAWIPYPDETTLSRVVSENVPDDCTFMVGCRITTYGEYESWKNEPNQVSWIQEKAMAQEGERIQKELDQRNAKIAEYMNVFGYTYEQAEYELIEKGRIRKI